MSNYYIKENMSIYICPTEVCYRKNHSESFIYDQISNLDIGQIYRIDMFDRDGKRGAVVHFSHSYWHDSCQAQYIITRIFTNSFKLIVSDDEYWYIKKLNKPPIQDTVYNIHQLADMCEQILYYQRNTL